jgi:hypothetical protein
VHPYLLGVWLGDGNSSGGTITVGEEDFEAELLQVTLAGADTELVNSYNDLKAIQYRIKGLTPALRQLNLIGNKHIPFQLPESVLQAACRPSTRSHGHRWLHQRREAR